MAERVTVICELPIEGFHLWLNAIDEVKFLRHPHRHTFVIRMAFGVEHDDRDKEIFILRDMIRRFIEKHYGLPAQFGPMSCESIARILLEQFREMDVAWVEVWEETTGGARIDVV